MVVTRLDAEPRGGHRLQALLRDLFATSLAAPVVAFVELLERALDIVELLAQRGRQPARLALLRVTLTGVGEVLVVAQLVATVGTERIAARGG